MEPFSFLETTAEISIAFAGFVSVFFVLARRDGSFAPAVAMSIRLVLFAGVFCMFAAALPLILAASGLSGTALWRSCSSVFLVSHAMVSVYALRQLGLFRVPGLKRYVNVTLLLSALAFVFPLSNVVGWPLLPNGGLYLAMVWLILGLGAANFLGLVLNRLVGQSVA